MKNQIIITVGRESGSGGHAIAKKLADAMGIACYDKKKLVEGTAEISGMNKNYVKKLDEKPAGFPFSGRIGAFEESPESNVARMTFEYIRKIADSGESCVIVGRCADAVLCKNPNDFYSDTKWGDSRAYDLIINSSKLGIQGTVEIIRTFAEAFKEE